MEQTIVEKSDATFKYEIASRPGAQHFTRCFSCGTCTASCPVSEVETSFNPRLIIRRALLGDREELLSSREIWHCAQCYTCYARCPQDVRFTDILAVLRQMAVEGGYASTALLHDMKKIDVLSQQIRLGLAELAIDVESGAADDSETLRRVEEIKHTLDEGVKRLGENG